VYDVVFCVIMGCVWCSVPCDYGVCKVSCPVCLRRVYGVVFCEIVGCVWCSVLCDYGECMV